MIKVYEKFYWFERYVCEFFNICQVIEYEFTRAFINFNKIFVDGV